MLKEFIVDEREISCMDPKFCTKNGKSALTQPS
jgi:hypothetical protein